MLSSFHLSRGLYEQAQRDRAFPKSFLKRWRGTTLPALAVAAVLSAGSAIAADLPSLKEPVAPLPEAFSWTGFYVGVNAGGGIDHVSFPYSIALPGGSTYGQSGLTERGPAFGGQIGYNYQFSAIPLLSNIVAGVELGADWSNINGSSTIGTNVGWATFGTRIENFGTIRGRLGYSFDRLLVYFAGGISYATTENYFNVPGFSGSFTSTRFPLRSATYGIGAEYALTNNWSLRAEYLYDYVKAGYAVYSGANDSTVAFLSRTTFHVARLGLNYKFDFFTAPAPVVTKY